MTTPDKPLMGKKQLIKSTFIAFVIGAVVLVTAVLPAEYGIDPLGTGKLFGFSRLHQKETPKKESQGTPKMKFRKIKLAEVGSGPDIPKPEEANNPAPKTQFEARYDSITVNVPPKKGIEYKFKTLKHGSVTYEWSTNDDTVVYLDFHGEVKEENPPADVFYESYTVAYASNMAGTLTAPFEGKHGWYFRNNSDEAVTISIILKGEYQLFEK